MAASTYTFAVYQAAIWKDMGNGNMHQCMMENIIYFKPLKYTEHRFGGRLDFRSHFMCYTIHEMEAFS